MEQEQQDWDRFLEHASNSNKSFEMRDSTGLRLTFAGLLPINTGDDGEQRIWASSITLNSSEIDAPQVSYKLRVAAKRGVDPKVTSDSSKGDIKKDDIVVIPYQMPESSIEIVRMTLVINENTYKVPLFKIRKADYYWLGKETDVPDVEKWCQNRAVHSPKMEATPINQSPGRFEHLSGGLRTFLGGTQGFTSVCKLLHPHATSLFRDISMQSFESFDWNNLMDEGRRDDDIAAEIVKRFHEANREKYATTQTLLNQ